MKLLLDTHALLFWLADLPLSDTAASAIGDPSSQVVVSAASLWEAAIKTSTGKLRVEAPLAPHVDSQGFGRLPVTFEHAEAVGELPPHHRDPFDRLLVAQARVERLTIVTRDRAFDAYDVPVMRC